MKFTKTPKMTYPDFAKAIDKLAALTGFEVSPEQAEGLYQQVYFMPLVAFRRACWHYVYRRKEKFRSNMLMDLRAKTHEYAGDFSDIMPTAISARPSPEKLIADQKWRDGQKLLPAPQKEKPMTASQLAQKMAIPPEDTPATRAVEERKEKQLAELKALQKSQVTA